MTAAEREQKRREAADIYRAQVEADLKTVLALPAGRRLLWNLTQEKAGVLRSSYAATDRDTAFREGKRSVGLDLLTKASAAAPADFRLMVTEGMLALAEAAERADPE